MLAVQERVVSLLAEIDEMCRAAGIEYSLTERTALMALENGCFTDREYAAEIMMRAADYAAFAKLPELADRTDRTLETPAVNMYMDGIYARYVDRTTLLWDVEEGDTIRDKGVAVIIRILRSGKKEAAKYSRLEQVVRNNGREGLWAEMKYGDAELRVRTLKLMLARLFYRKADKISAYFGQCLKDKGSSKNVFYYGDKDGRVFARECVSEYRDIEFEGKTLRILSDAEALKKSIGKLDVENIRRDTDKFGVIIDLERPYEDFLREAREQNLYGSRAKRIQNDYFAFVKRDYRRKIDAVNIDHNYMKRSIRRMELWEIYKDKTEEIKALYESKGVCDEIRKEMAEYTAALEYFCKRDLGFAIDRDLLKIAYAVLEADGKKFIVDKVKGIMPREYLETVGDFLRREGYGAKI